MVAVYCWHYLIFMFSFLGKRKGWKAFTGTFTFHFVQKVDKFSSHYFLGIRTCPSVPPSQLDTWQLFSSPKDNILRLKTCTWLKSGDISQECHSPILADPPSSSCEANTGIIQTDVCFLNTVLLQLNKRNFWTSVCCFGNMCANGCVLLRIPNKDFPLWGEKL